MQKKSTLFFNSKRAYAGHVLLKSSSVGKMFLKQRAWEFDKVAWLPAGGRQNC